MVYTKGLEQRLQELQRLQDGIYYYLFIFYFTKSLDLPFPAIGTFGFGDFPGIPHSLTLILSSI